MTRRVVVTLLVVLSCKGTSEPSGPPADVAGAWAFGQRMTGGGISCANHGTVTITQNGSHFSATYSHTGFCAGPGGTVDNSGSGDITTGTVNGAAIQFSIPGCSYRGNVVGDPPDGATGTVSCQIMVNALPVVFSGTWRVSHGVASVTVTPNPALIGTDVTVPLTATAYDASGNELTGRTIVWRSLDPAIATVTAGSARGITPGVATITAATVPLLQLEDSAIGYTNVQVMTRAVGISAGWLHSCGVLAGGGALCWGAGFDGRLGNGTSDHPVETPRPVSGPPLARVSGGFQHSCGTTSTGVAYCWGKELAGELGDGVSSATRLAPVAVSGGLSFATVSAGNNFSCGVTTAGTGYCWGYGGGRLGRGSFGDDSTPAPLTGGLTFAMITTGKDVELQPVGNGFACGLTTGGAAYCWGNNSHGELGDGGSSSHSAPVPVAGGLTFATLSAGYQHVCGVTTSGAAYCWGNGSSGQLGNGSAGGSNAPVPVSGGLLFSTIAAGSGHTCAVTTGGDAYCWGINTLGQLGTGVFAPDFSPPQTTPVAVVGGLKFDSLAAGAAHTCGVTTVGVMYCWGRGLDGQLGSPGGNRAAPTAVFVP